MLKGRAFWLVAAAISLAMTGMAKAGEGDDQARLKAEAKALFHVVLADEHVPERCELDVEWDTYPIPESVAREYLGLKIHAELSSPFSGTDPREILDLGANSDAFCDQETAKKLQDDRLKEFQEGSDKTLDVSGTRYTFPVFDGDYKTAILVVSHSNLEWYRKPEGIMNFPLGSALGYAAIYTLNDGVWKRLTTVQLFIS